MTFTYILERRNEFFTLLVNGTPPLSLYSRLCQEGAPHQPMKRLLPRGRRRSGPSWRPWWRERWADGRSLGGTPPPCSASSQTAQGSPSASCKSCGPPPWRCHVVRVSGVMGEERVELNRGVFCICFSFLSLNEEDNLFILMLVTLIYIKKNVILYQSKDQKYK